jgi:hypothetical protein
MWTSPYAPVEVGGTTLHQLVLEAGPGPGTGPGTGRPWSTARRGRRSTTGCWPRGSGGWRPGWPRAGSGPGTCSPCGAPNLPRWAGVALGAMAAGGTVTGANPACTERELTTQLTDGLPKGVRLTHANRHSP